MSKKKTVPGGEKPPRRAFGRMDVKALMKANGAHNVAARTEVLEIPLQEIVADSPVQTRAPFDPKGDRDDGGFLDNMREFGQRIPALLVELEPGKYETVSGHRRIAALRYLGKNIVLAEITSANEFDRITDAVIANVFRITSPSEKVRIVEFLVGQGRKNGDIAKVLGIEKRYMQKLKAISRADDAVQLALSKEQIGVMTAIVLSQAPISHQPRLTKIVVENRMNVADAQELVKHVKTADKAPDEAATEFGLVFPPTEIEGAPTSDAPPPNSPRPPRGRGEENSTPEPRITVSSSAVTSRLRNVFPDYDKPARLQAVAGAASEQSATWRSGLLAGILIAGELEQFLPTRDKFEAADAAIKMARSMEQENIMSMALSAARLRGEIHIRIARQDGEISESGRLIFQSLGKLYAKLGESKSAED